MAYAVPAAQFEHEIEVKRSRFIARVVPVSQRSEVNAAVAQARRDYPDARHHCWAYLLGEPRDASNAGMSDDGEPAGTAGKPILNVLQHGAVGDVLVIVIRYFGGVKLGAGGLVRAYGGATQQALDHLPVVTPIAMSRCQLSAAFSDEQPLRHQLSQWDGLIEGLDYADGVTLKVAVPEAELASLRAYCAARGIEVSE